MKLFLFYVPWSGHDGWKIVLQKHVIYRVMWSSFFWRHFIVHSCFYLNILSSIRFFFIRQKSLLHVIKHLKKKNNSLKTKQLFFLFHQEHTQKKNTGHCTVLCSDAECIFIFIKLSNVNFCKLGITCQIFNPVYLNKITICFAKSYCINNGKRK